MKKRILIFLLSLICLTAVFTPSFAVLAEEEEQPIVEQTEEERGLWDEIKAQIDGFIKPVIVTLGGANLIQLFFIITTLVKSSARKTKDEKEKLSIATEAKTLRNVIAEFKAHAAEQARESEEKAKKAIDAGLEKNANLLIEAIGGNGIVDAKLDGVYAALRAMTNNPKVHAALAEIPTAAVIKRQEIAIRTLIDEIAEQTEADKEKLMLKIEEAMENAKLGNVSTV